MTTMREITIRARLRTITFLDDLAEERTKAVLVLANLQQAKNTIGARIDLIDELGAELVRSREVLP